MERSSGVLLHISSLPGPYGIGTMGHEARQFCDRLAEAGVRWWQVLPLTQPSEAEESSNSPYNCYSAFAGNIWLIDPRLLAEDLDLLEDHELRDFMSFDDAYLTDYGFVRHNVHRFLGLAFSRLTESRIAELRRFLEEEPWLLDYATFRCAKDEFEHLPWWDWPEEIRRREPEALAQFQEENQQHILYVAFCQWIFHRQWAQLQDYCHERGVQIFGDIPIYVASDSCDIWVQPELFRLDKDFNQLERAGVPPDYFAEDGQLWGNTLYDWEAMRRDDYRWWVERIRHAMRLYDRLRIDHFRGFDSYWVVPAEAETAREGRWAEGPGMALFERIHEELGELDIVAEDLGEFADSVRDFLAASGYPGMFVLQFAFDPDSDGTDRPHYMPRHACAYTGTHDNDTLLGWLWHTTAAERRLALDYIGFPQGQPWGEGGPQSPACRAFIRFLWASAADFACVPIQDLCGFGSDTRMNVPGVAENCWRFRVTQDALSAVDFGWLGQINRLYGRYWIDPADAIAVEDESES